MASVRARRPRQRKRRLPPGVRPVREYLYRFDKADVILSLDSDFLCYGPGSVRYARDFADKRRIVDAKAR